MSTPIDELTKLPLAERLEIVERLWDSIAVDADQLPLTEAQAEELDRRLKEHEVHPGEGESWDHVRERLRRSR